MLDHQLSVRSSANIGRKLKDQEYTESQSEGSDKGNVIIGIDYGTSFSGAAYTLYKQRPVEPAVTTISDWPHSNSHRTLTLKCPSDIAYDDRGNAHCGFDIPDDCQRLKWVKLLLETDFDERKAGLLQAEEVVKSRERLLQLGKTAVEAVADYLRWFWDTICRIIADDEEDPDIFKNSNVTVMLTVPAMWSDAAKENTFQAAELAGICDEGRVIKFITEPEAAAIAELQIRIAKGQLEQSDCVIICDAGGGTVDLVSYQVRKVNPIELDQVVVADGGLCGSTWIDDEFLNQIKSLMQSDWDKLSQATKDEIKEKFAYSIKPSFEGVDKARKDILRVHPETGSFRHISDGRLVVEPEVVRVSFETVLPQILSLIDDQEESLEKQGLRHKLRGILLVGGLGSSRFVHSRIEQNFGREEGIKVWRGRQSWSSVVEGAVKCAFMSLGNIHQITSRKSRFNYGIPFHPPFDPTQHRPEDRFTCPYEGTSKARLVQWLLRKGQDIKPKDAPQVYDFTKIVRTTSDLEGGCSTGFSLLQSSQDNAPDYLTSAVKDSVKVECYFNQNILNGSWHKVYGVDRDLGKMFWKVVVQLQVIMLPSAQVVFQCLLSGQNMVSTNISYRSNEKPKVLVGRQAADNAPNQFNADRQLSVRSQANTMQKSTALMSNEPVDFRTASLPSLSRSSIASQRANPRSPNLSTNDSFSTTSFITFDSSPSKLDLVRSQDSVLTSSTSFSDHSVDDNGVIMSGALSSNRKIQKSEKKGGFWRRTSKTVTSIPNNGFENSNYGNQRDSRHQSLPLRK